MRTSEEETWDLIDSDDLWVLDKLILSRKLGYVCGPVGIDVPKPGRYIVRPAINPIGMGKDAHILWIDRITDHLPTGHFWCELFHGKHESFDYHYGDQILAVEGLRPDTVPLYRWNKWIRTNTTYQLPDFLQTLAVRYEYLNVETIGSKIIEVHFRCNPDFFIDGFDTISEVIPVWVDEDYTYRPEYTFLPHTDFKRKGIYVK